ncbi:26S_protease regulatory subunit 8 [Hexamita inflata]|uniref:26S protease regulatory subunit 8 n=1 Tax=Hexamita inflata TaxID=28002 RepID=A0AA86Q5K0_9EUKA|nr:26S protease regulatory subunit 8 [Hexamita inflata]CAI9954381.1 26S protease regulatory subunit 8 [Hexamita inflata]CAI9954844.1 26S protease regulatory subunit 8 [Hexamita inflata]CAI9977710.1 26S protease regulatory subunit 8 [Hexamita inflata]
MDLQSYYTQRVQNLQSQIQSRQLQFSQLQTLCDDMNAKIRRLQEEIHALQEPSLQIAEVIKLVSNTRCLVKQPPDDRSVVPISAKINVSDLKPGVRVGLRSASEIVMILPQSVDPVVNLMKIEKVPDCTYDQIGGLNKQINELREIIELPIKCPELFTSLGVEPGHGVILCGPPGTGKTLLAKAVAHHCGTTFIRISGSELISKYIGEGARMVRELFQMAKQHQPSIIFIDEADSIGGKRYDSASGAEQEVQRTMLELLSQLDGFEPNTQIKLIMATNRIDMLDDALLRPGRIDRKIELPPPNAEARVQIIKIHSRKMNVQRNVDFVEISKKMDGANGADCRAVCNEAGIAALREKRGCIIQEDFEAAVAKVMKKEWAAGQADQARFVK